MAYMVGTSMGGQDCGGGLDMIDMQSPAEPVFLSCFADQTPRYPAEQQLSLTDTLANLRLTMSLDGLAVDRPRDLHLVRWAWTPINGSGNTPQGLQLMLSTSC